MKKKTFLQSNIGWQIFCFALLAAALACTGWWISMIVKSVQRGIGDIVFFLFAQGVCFLVALYLFFSFIKFERNNIHLTEEKIYMKDDWNGKRSKLQHYAEVKFAEIASVDIVWTNNDSKGNNIKAKATWALIPKPYLSIKTKNGDITNFFIMYFAKEDVVKIVDEVQKRMKYLGNSTEIIQKKELIQKLTSK